MTNIIATNFVGEQLNRSEIHKNQLAVLLLLLHQRDYNHHSNMRLHANVKEPKMLTDLRIIQDTLDCKFISDSEQGERLNISR